MFREKLADKLKIIFGVDKVLFDDFTLGKEQGVLFVDIDNVKDYRTENRKSLIIDGRISFCEKADKNKFSLLHDKIEMAENNLTSGIWFARNERSIKYNHNNNDFVKYDIDFIYSFNDEFVKTRDKIENIEVKGVYDE